MYRIIEDHIDYKKFNSVIILRGFIINRANAVEEEINRVMAYRYHENYKESLEYIDNKLQEMPWSKKIDEFKKNLSEDNLEELIKSTEANETLYDILDRIIKVRHMMAHHRWARVWEDGASFKKGRLKTESVLSEEVVNKYLSDCTRAINILNKIQTKIGYWNSLFSQLLVKP